jgi:DNA-directed RNA polymerase subunit RPC12/RpoP
MDSASYECRYCGKATKIAASKIFNMVAIRCESCRALSAITDKERRELLAQGIPGASMPGPPEVMRSNR